MEGALQNRIADLRFPGTAAVVQGNGGLQKVRITSPEVEGRCTAWRAHHSWKPHGAKGSALSQLTVAMDRDTRFVEAYYLFSPGLEARRTTRKRRRTGSCERRRGS